MLFRTVVVLRPSRGLFSPYVSLSLSIQGFLLSVVIMMLVSQLVNVVVYGASGYLGYLVSLSVLYLSDLDLGYIYPLPCARPPMLFLASRYS